MSLRNKTRTNSDDEQNDYGSELEILSPTAAEFGITKTVNVHVIDEHGGFYPVDYTDDFSHRGSIPKA